MAEASRLADENQKTPQKKKLIQDDEDMDDSDEEVKAITEN